MATVTFSNKISLHDSNNNSTTFAVFTGNVDDNLGADCVYLEVGNNDSLNLAQGILVSGCKDIGEYISNDSPWSPQPGALIFADREYFIPGNLNLSHGDTYTNGFLNLNAEIVPF